LAQSTWIAMVVMRHHLRRPCTELLRGSRQGWL
jgi:hypothetical protein